MKTPNCAAKERAGGTPKPRSLSPPQATAPPESENKQLNSERAGFTVLLQLRRGRQAFKPPASNRERNDRTGKSGFFSTLTCRARTGTAPARRQRPQPGPVGAVGGLSGPPPPPPAQGQPPRPCWTCVRTSAPSRLQSYRNIHSPPPLEVIGSFGQ